MVAIDANRYQLKAYQHVVLAPEDHAQGLIYSMHTIKEAILSFVKTYRLYGARAFLSLQAPCVVEKIIRIAVPSAYDVAYSEKELQGLCVEYSHLYDIGDGTSVMYVCGIRPETYLQHRLLLHMAAIDIALYTTALMGHIFLYKKVYGDAFRKGLFALDMQRHNNDIGSLFTHEWLARVIEVPDCLSDAYEKDFSCIVTSVGTYVAGELV